MPTWSNLQFGMRITGPKGDPAQTIVTSTPRATELVRKLVASPYTEITGGTTYENKKNLDPSFVAAVLTEYEGTRLGQQELEGKLLGDTPGALFKMEQIEGDRLVRAPETLSRLIVAVDPAVADAEERRRARDDEEHVLAETGIVVAARGICFCNDRREEHGFVLDDLSGYFPPDEWAKIVLQAYEQRKADRVIAEVNNGGALVEANLKAQANARFAYKAVHASRGKAIRAEPVATLYEKHVVHHVGVHPKLEDQLTTWSPLHSRKSPDRLDANVWAFTELLLEPRAASLRSILQPVAPRRM
jgi:phage terminase large subunit-like protein